MKIDASDCGEGGLEEVIVSTIEVRRVSGAEVVLSEVPGGRVQLSEYVCGDGVRTGGRVLSVKMDCVLYAM